MSTYLLVKAAHIIFMVAWMASLLVYPRYKLHQLSSKPGDELFEAMQLAAAKLRRIIMTPSLILVWLLGIVLLSMNPGVFHFKWILVKLVLVVLLTALHGFFVKTGKAIDRGDTSVTPRALKLTNELPFVVLVIVVILAVVKPF